MKSEAPTRALLDPDRLFSPDPAQRKIARSLYDAVCDLPIVSPHGHTDPGWFSENEPFADPAHLLIVPDHYLFRMLYSRGVPLERLGIARSDGGPVEEDPRAIWRLFAENYHLFRGTPSRLWIDHTLSAVFDFDERLRAENADEAYDEIARRLATEAFRPRALFDRFGIEVLATTESPLDPLEHHRRIRESGWSRRIVTTFRPDPVPYWSLSLVNYWYEPLAFREHLGARQTSTAFTNATAEFGDDGTVRAVLADCPPRGPNWLDTRGHLECTVLFRISRSKNPVPPLDAEIVRLEDL